MITDLTTAQWRMLVRRIYDGRCVPFLGAAANVRTDGKGLPLGRDVAMRLVEELLEADELVAVNELAELTKQRAESLGAYGDLASLGIYNLARVALHYRRENDPAALRDLLRAIIGEEACEPSPLLSTLAGLRRKSAGHGQDGEKDLPLRLIVTTNYDRMMERALDDREIGYQPVYQPVSGFDRATSQSLDLLLSDPKVLILYKIHGSFRDNGAGPESRLIVTEDDYIEFLTVATRKDDPVGVPLLIESELVDSTLLFLGYSLEDWDFRTIYKGLIEKLQPHERRQSFAIHLDPPAFWVDFWSKKDVTIVDMEVTEFAERLVTACDKHRQRTGERVYVDLAD